MEDANKRIRKKIRFDFYKIESSDKKVRKKDINLFFANLFNYYMTNNNLKTHLEIKDEIIEIEPNSLYLEDHLYFFLISNLRSDTLPTKKKLGKEGIEIKLDSDEYIGEFTGVLYDSINGVFSIQINKYGVHPSKIINYLYKLFFSSLKSINENLSEDDIIKKEAIENTAIKMIVDSDELKKIKDSKEIRQIRLKSSTTALEAITDKEVKPKNWNQIREIVTDFGNVNFEISITANYEKQDSLDKEKSKNFIDSFLKFLYKDKEESNLIVKRKENDESNVETIDFLLPKLKRFINFSIEPKKSIGRTLLRSKMTEAYNKVKVKIIKTVGA